VQALRKDEVHEAPSAELRDRILTFRTDSRRNAKSGLNTIFVLTAPLAGQEGPEKPVAAAPQVFVRQSTGLVKNVSFFDSIAMNMSNMSVGALLGVIGIGAMLPMVIVGGQSVDGVNLVLLSVISFVLSVPQIVIYTIMSRRYPRSGGDYVYVSRNLGGAAGSILSFMGYTMETTAYLALIVLSTVFAIGTIGLFFDPTNATYLGLAVPTGSGGPALPGQQFLVGVAIFAVLIAINILKPKAGFKLVSILTVFGFFAIILAVAELLSAGHAGVVNYINSLGAQGVTYDSVAASGGSTFFSWGPTLFLLPLMAAFVYPWLNASPAVAAEIRGKSALKWNVPISAVTVFVFLTGSLAVMYYVAGQAFTNGAYSDPTLVFDYGFNFWTLAMGVSGNQIVAAIIGLGWVLANLSVLAYGIIVISRYLLAQSFDRFLPSRISGVSSRFGSPVVAHLVDLILTLGLVGFAAYYYVQVGITNPLFGAILASMVYFIFVGLSAALHGVRKEKGGTRGALVLAGILNIFVFGYLSYEFLAYPDVWGLNSLTGFFIGGSIVAGILLYFGSKWYNKKRGIDISLAYKELPPE
jgi:glutamate:GABA antiporter